MDNLKKDKIIKGINEEKAALLKDRRNNNQFPIHAFPESIQQIITETKDKLKFNIDFIGSSILYASSVAIGNSHKVKVKNGWIDSSAIYMAIVGGAGTNKSHPLSFATAPINKKQEEYYIQYKEEIKRYELSESTKSNNETSDSIQKPILRKVILSDCTPEAVASVLSNNPRGIGLCVDELNGWLSSFNQYSKGNEEEFWLSNWSGKPLIIDRKNQPPIYIPSPNISICGTIQTKLLKNLSKGNKGVNGFLDRVLIVYPQGLKKEYINELELDNFYKEKWDRIINRLFDTNPFDVETEEFQSKTLEFEDDAKKILFNWMNNNTDLINSIDDNVLQGNYIKLEMYCIRFSLILYLLQCVCNSNPIVKIDITSVKGAIELTEYFKRTAELSRSSILNISPLDDLPKAKKMFYDSLPDSIKLSEAYKHEKDKFDFSNSTIRRFLNDESLFRRVKQGFYEKVS